MQYHSEFNPVSENRDRSPWNIAERYNDPRALTVYRRYAKLRMGMLEKLYSIASLLAQQGKPMMRYPQLEYPDAHGFLSQDPYAYVFGQDLLVCPVVEKGASAREVCLPPGQWLDFWSGAEWAGLQKVVVPASLERIPVFISSNSADVGFWRGLAELF